MSLNFATDACCRVCEYWYHAHDKLALGECRANSPDQHLDRATWPRTLGEEWCGKFSLTHDPIRFDPNAEPMRMTVHEYHRP